MALQFQSFGATQEVKVKAELTKTTIHDMPIFEMWMGQQKGGKTFLCGSASEAWPENNEKVLGAAPEFLHDMYWICVDPNCLLGFASKGISVRHVDILGLLQERKATNYFDAWKKAMDECAEQCIKHPEIRTVVFDTPSNFDFFMDGYYREKLEDSKNRYAVPQAMASTHAKLLQILVSLPVDLRLLPCHGTVDNDVADVMEGGGNVSFVDRAKIIPASMPGDNIIRPALTGKSVRNYQGLVDSVGTLECTVDLKGNFVRKILPYGGSGWRGGTRLHEVLKTTEEPNLFKLHKKVKEYNNRFNVVQTQAQVG